MNARLLRAKGTEGQMTMRMMLAALGLIAQVLPVSAQQSAPNAMSALYQDWTVTCIAPEGSAAQCEMVQALSAADTGQPVLQVVLRRDASATGLTVIAPFGLRLAEGAKVRVDGRSLMDLAFSTCLPAGCLLPKILDPAEIAALKAGAVAELQFVDTAGQALPLSISLSGFSDALARLEQECCGT